MRLYYELSNLVDVKEVLVHDLVLTDDDNEIIISGIEPEGNDEGGRWKGVEINGVEDNKYVIGMIEDAFENGYKLTNCMITGDWIDDHAEITLTAELVIKDIDCSDIKRINLTPEPVTIEFDE